MTSNLKKPHINLAEFKEWFTWQKGIIFLCFLFLIGWLYWTPSGLLGKADAVGYAVCHRIDSRSFHIGDRQSPLCARCTGQYLGAMSSLIFLAIFRPRRIGRPPWVIVGFLIFFVGFYAVDGLNSYIHLIPQLSRFYLYEPGNTLRLMSGTGLGLGMGVLVFPAYNSTVWKKIDPRPVLEGVKDFSALLAVGVLIDLFVLSENPLLIYPLALVSAGGVLVLLTLIYTMVLIIISKKENTFENQRKMGIMLVAGFIIALMQITILDVLRFMLTGTWNGFHFG